MADDTHPPASLRRGLTDVQLSKLAVNGLFGRYNHEIPLSGRTEQDFEPSVVILYGPNGVGKTTILRMLDGLMRLDFDVFREMPFDDARLEFSTDQCLTVKRLKNYLKVDFDDLSVNLTATLGQKGAANQRDTEKVEQFRSYFFRSVENISLNYIAADRAQRIRHPETTEAHLREYLTSVGQWRRRATPAQTPLADQVKRFINEALLDTSPFFLTGSPDIFSRILDELSRLPSEPKSASQILKTFENAHAQDLRLDNLGLRGSRWDYDRITGMLQEQKYADSPHTLTVLSTYANVLMSDIQARSLIAERLLTFQAVMNEFFEDKIVEVNSANGLTISTGNATVEESQLSSGEIQLLYLMVAALTTRRKGTVIAIDEPELSMHLRWQKQLVESLRRCASRAAPLFVLATHSPDVAAQYSEYMIELPPAPKTY